MHTAGLVLLLLLFLRLRTASVTRHVHIIQLARRTVTSIIHLFIFPPCAIVHYLSVSAFLLDMIICAGTRSWLASWLWKELKELAVDKVHGNVQFTLSNSLGGIIMVTDLLRELVGSPTRSFGGLSGFDSRS